MPNPGRFTPLATECQPYLDALKTATDNAEAYNALKALHDLILPWLRAFRPEAPIPIA